MINEKTFNGSSVYAIPEGKSLYDVAGNLKRFLATEEEMETQILKTEDESYFVQARARSGSLKQLLGMDRMISVKLTPVNGRSMVVEIGRGKWMDKIAAGTLACILISPIFVMLPAIGVYRQGMLPRKVINNIESFLAC